jgi:hypothetical protein
MEIREFFELSTGKWFSLKTSHHLEIKQSEQGKSELEIDILPSDSPQVSQICQQAGIDPSAIWGGVRYRWDGTLVWDTHPQTAPNRRGERIAILVPDAPAAKVGKLLQSDSKGEAAQVGRYTMGTDNALTLITERGDTRSEERMWYESDNVRLRTTIVTQANGNSLASFYSEIRRVTK